MLLHTENAGAGSVVVQTLRPSRVVYIDPAFSSPSGWKKILLGMLLAFLRTPSRGKVAKGNPRWSDEDVDIEVATVGLWDRRTVFGLARGSTVRPLADLVAPTLLVLADHSALVPAELADSLRGRGAQVEVVAGAGHVVFRDDFEGFLAKADGWL